MMNTPFNGLPQGADRIVYVREVAVTDLPDEVREQMDGLEVIWSVHGADGRQLSWSRTANWPSTLRANMTSRP